MLNLKIMVMTLRNLTPHKIAVFNREEKKEFTIEPEGVVPRVKMVKSRSEDFGTNHVNLSGHQHRIEVDDVFASSEVENLPQEEGNVFLIISRTVAEAVPERNDLIIPNDTVRDENGRIVGCKSFARIVPPRERKEWVVVENNESMFDTKHVNYIQFDDVIISWHHSESEANENIPIED